jgi:hypothetical protein
VLLVGLGGVGMMGLAFARALFGHAPVVADIDAGSGRRRSRRAPRPPTIRPIQTPARRWSRPPAASTARSISSARTARLRLRPAASRRAARSSSPACSAVPTRRRSRCFRCGSSRSRAR